MSLTGYKNNFEGRLMDFVRRFLHESGDNLPTIRLLKEDITGGAYVNAKRQGMSTAQLINSMVNENELALRAVFDLPGGGSAFSNAYIVPDQAAADALTGLEPGDFVFIQDNGTGNWSLQIVEAVTDGAYPTSTITNIINEDSIAQAVVGLLQYKGGYDVAGNSPDLTTSPNSILTGDTWTVTVAGSFFGENMEVGDMLIAEVDSPAALSDWTRVNKNIDLTQDQQDAINNANSPSAANPFATISDLDGLDEIIVVDTLAQAQALTGLQVSNVVYVTQVGTLNNPFKVIIYDITAGDTWALAKKNYFGYEAGGRAVKNEGTADLTTDFLSGNNVPVPLVTRLAGTGAQQLINMDVLLEDNTQFLRVVDPLQIPRASGNAVFSYEYTAVFSVSSSNASSVYEFHFVLKTGGVANVLIDSVRWQPDSANEVHTIAMNMQAVRGFNDKVGVYVERTQGGGILTLERFSLVGKFVGQRGYFP